jgi:hypothetical protein
VYACVAFERSIKHYSSLLQSTIMLYLLRHACCWLTGQLSGHRVGWGQQLQCASRHAFVPATFTRMHAVLCLYAQSTSTSSSIGMGRLFILAPVCFWLSTCGHVHLPALLVLHCCCKRATCCCTALTAALHVFAPAAAEAASKQQEKHSLVSVWEDHEMKEGETGWTPPTIINSSSTYCWSL